MSATDVTPTPERSQAPGDVPETAVRPDPVLEEVAQTVQDAEHGNLAGVVADAETLKADPIVGQAATLAVSTFKESKAGYKTTEFWTSLVVGVLDLVTQIPFHAKLATSVVAAIYAVARGLAKAGVPYQEDPTAGQPL